MNTPRHRPSVTEAFDNLERCTGRVQALLKDRQPGIMAWNIMLKDNCIELDMALRGLGIPPQVLDEAEYDEDEVQHG